MCKILWDSKIMATCSKLTNSGYLGNRVFFFFFFLHYVIFLNILFSLSLASSPLLYIPNGHIKPTIQLLLNHSTAVSPFSRPSNAQHRASGTAALLLSSSIRSIRSHAVTPSPAMGKRHFLSKIKGFKVF